MERIVFVENPTVVSDGIPLFFVREKSAPARKILKGRRKRGPRKLTIGIPEKSEEEKYETVVEIQVPKKKPGVMESWKKYLSSTFTKFLSDTFNDAEIYYPTDTDTSLRIKFNKLIPEEEMDQIKQIINEELGMKTEADVRYILKEE